MQAQPYTRRPMNIQHLEHELWHAADILRSGSKLTPSEYAPLVLGLIFLRHASWRFNHFWLAAQAKVPANMTSELRLNWLKTFYRGHAAVYLEEHARFDHIAQLKGNAAAKADAVEAAFDSIERNGAEGDTLSGVLPRGYHALGEQLSDLLRIFSSPAVEAAINATHGDVLGRVYEYFLNEFARVDAQGGGEFFTPPSLVRTIVAVIEPQLKETGLKVLDPACGAGGMFIHTAQHLQHHNPGRDLAALVNYIGQDKADKNRRHAIMNMLVHGMDVSGIVEGNTFYEPMATHIGCCDFVMANPPFNMDGVEATRAEADPRLPFGLPGKKGKTQLISNANSLWLQYFYAYLNDTGRAGFVMAASASDAGHKDRDIRQQLIETGHVDVMISIGPKFFYTVTLPCTLWFYDRGKGKDLLDQVLMIDARSIYTVVSARHHTFSDEQLANLATIVYLYRGQNERLGELLAHYQRKAAEHLQSLPALIAADDAYMAALHSAISAAMPAAVSSTRLDHSALLAQAAACCEAIAATAPDAFQPLAATQAQLTAALPALEAARAAIAQRHKNAIFALDEAEKALAADKARAKALKTLREATRPIRAALANADTQRGQAPTHRDALMAAIDAVAYFHAQATWLLERFPNGYYEDVAGLCRIATREEIAANDYSLTPGRYVGVAAADAQHGDDFKTEMAALHDELATLNAQAAELAARIQKNWGEML